MHEGAWEVEVGALGGLHWMWTIGSGARSRSPWGPREPWAWRFESQVGAMRLDAWKWPTIRLGFGVDFEALVR